MSAAISLAAADAMVKAIAGLVADVDDTVAADLAPLLRGHARDDDGAAFDLLGRLGFSPATIAKTLPAARALARAQTGA